MLHKHLDLAWVTFRQVFATAKPMDVTDSFPSPTGLRWFESRCVPERDSSGSVRSVLVISREVTERRRTEEALRLSEAMFRGLFENTGVGIAMGDPNGRLTLVNPALSQMLGYSREELASMTLADITHLDDMEMEKPYIQEVLDGRR